MCFKILFLKKKAVFMFKGQHTIEELEKLADQMLTFVKNKKAKGRRLLNDFFIKKGIKPSMVAEYCKRSKKFADSYEVAKMIQEKNLIEIALADPRTSTFVSFLLRNLAGYSDKSELMHTGGITVTINEYGSEQKFED